MCVSSILIEAMEQHKGLSGLHLDHRQSYDGTPPFARDDIPGRQLGCRGNKAFVAPVGYSCHIQPRSTYMQPLKSRSQKLIECIRRHAHPGDLYAHLRLRARCDGSQTNPSAYALCCKPLRRTVPSRMFDPLSIAEILSGTVRPNRFESYKAC